MATASLGFLSRRFLTPVRSYLESSNRFLTPVRSQFESSKHFLTPVRTLFESSSKNSIFGEGVPNFLGSFPPPRKKKGGVYTYINNSAWTRRSKGENHPKNRKSWKQRSEKYLKPFKLNVYMSKKFINASVMHRVTSRVVAVASTNSKDLRETLESTNDENASEIIGKLVAERCKAADIYAVVFQLKKDEKYEGRLAKVVDTILENGIVLI